ELAAHDDKRYAIEWVEVLAGSEIAHDVVEVPLQVRAFRDARLEACLALTPWGNTEALEATGRRLAHAFDGDRCMVAAAPVTSLVELRSHPVERLRVTTAAHA